MQPFNQKVQGRHGEFLYNVHDAYVGQSLKEYGEYSKGEVDLFAQLIHSGMIVMEIGANIGAHTVPIARLCAPAPILAFEPQRLSFQTLCANVALNSLDNVWAFHAGCGAEQGFTDLPELNPRTRNNFGGFSITPKPLGERLDSAHPIPIVQLDSFDMPVNFLKIDAEGMEIEILQGGQVMIEKHKPILYLENDRQERSEALTKLLQEMGYRAWWHTPTLYAEDNFFQNQTNHFGDIISVNMLCVHKSIEDVDLQGFPRAF